jgi:hypothetical protein
MVTTQSTASAATKTVKKVKKTAKVKNHKQALKVVLKKVNPKKKTGIFYMTTKISKNAYQVEARQGRTGATKLKGLYRLNTKTMKVTQMNMRTGYFNQVR